MHARSKRSLVCLVLSLALMGCSAPAGSHPPIIRPPVAPGSITATEVRSVLASSNAETDTEYRWDAADYSASILAQTGEVATPTLAQAVAAFRRLEQSRGTSEAIAEMGMAGLGGEAGDPPATRDRILLGLLDRGTVTISLMFTPKNPEDWTWEITNVTVVDTDTARVSYRVAAPPGARWRFTRAIHSKTLRFSKDAAGQWRLSGWLNYLDFERGLRASVEPRSAISSQESWWDDLGWQ